MQRGIVLQKARQGVRHMVALMLHMQERSVFRLKDIVQPLDVEVKLGQISREGPDYARDRQMEVCGKSVGQKLGLVFEQAIQGMRGDLEATGGLSSTLARLSGITRPAWGWIATTSSHAEEHSFPNMHLLGRWEQHTGTSK